jgi:pimeloyl-ACP methyl ester carboxylesterase
MTAAARDVSFGALKQVDAGLLSVGYAEAGPPGSPAVILLHGWPYEVHCDDPTGGCGEGLTLDSAGWLPCS